MAIKFFKNITIKQKKALIISGIAVAILGIGLTIAYNMDLITFDNLFRIANSEEEYVDTFSSPDNWQPCEEIDKTAIATNKNETVRYARMKLDEYWRLKESQIVNPNDHTTTELPLTWNDNGTVKSYAIINTQNDDKWELKSDGWYYYKLPLRQNQSTLSLLKSVTLNCDASLVENGTATVTQNSQSGESVPTAYAGATYHLYVTMQLSDTPWQEPSDPNSLHSIVVDEYRESQYQIDFRRGATISDDVSIENGNGVRKYSEAGQDVYYYRGNVSDNNVVWHDYCWKILRTTATGGTKLIYNGIATATTSGNTTTYSCNATGNNTAISGPSFNSALSRDALANVGYKYGDARTFTSNTGNTRYYGHTLTRNDNSYSIGSDSLYTDFYVNRLQVANGYHYYCINGYREDSNNCDNSDGPGYIQNYDNSSSFYALPLSGYNDIEAAKAGIFANSSNSQAKVTVENFFGQHFASYQNELEDVPFCNDRSFYSGSLKGESEDATPIWEDVYSAFSGHGRNSVDVNNNYHPSLDCPNANDKFTKDSNNGNGELQYPVGLITADEAVLAGITDGGTYMQTNYLYNGQTVWTMTPKYIYYGAQPMMYAWQTEMYSRGISPYGGQGGYRPVISLKSAARIVSGGEGTTANPYVIE